MRKILPLGNGFYRYHFLREISFLFPPLCLWREHLTKNLLDYVAEEKIVPQKVLEIGCNTGFLSNILSKKFPNSIINSIDVVQETVEKAKKRDIKNVYFEKRDFFDIEEKYDLIVSMHVFVLFPLRNSIRKLSEVLSDRGYAYITYTSSTLLTELHKIFYKLVVGDIIEFKKKENISKIAAEERLNVKFLEIDATEGSFAAIFKKSVKNTGNESKKQCLT